MASLPPVVAVVGTSGSGKTTLLVRMVAELKRRGYRVATIKHHPHGFDLDRPGKDSWRHAEAGSDVVFLVSADRLAMIRQTEREWTVGEIGKLAEDADIILTEGYKDTEHLRVEVSRRAHSQELISAEEQLLAVVTDQRFKVRAPHFNLDDVGGLVDLIEERVLGQRAKGASFA